MPDLLTDQKATMRLDTAKGPRLALTVAIAAAGIDQLTKLWALSALGDGQRIQVLGDFIAFYLTHNPGAAFSLGTSTTWIFTLISVAFLIAIGIFVSKGTTTKIAIALGFLAGGAVGNLVDRLIRPPGIGVGHVVDFIDYNGWFVGNVADIWIVCAAVALAFLAMRTPEANATDSEAGDAEADEDQADA